MFGIEKLNISELADVLRSIAQELKTSNELSSAKMEKIENIRHNLYCMAKANESLAEIEKSRRRYERKCNNQSFILRGIGTVKEKLELNDEYEEEFQQKWK